MCEELGSDKREEGDRVREPSLRSASMRVWMLAFAVALISVGVGEVLEAPYYLTSVVVICCAVAPFFVLFERRRPRARELVVLAVLCAVAVASRIAFMWFPSFKPVVGIVMIAGAAFGAQVGFLTGAMSALVSNFIFGQGPWTPWQMLAFGIAGFIAGLAAHDGRLRRGRWSSKLKLAVGLFGFAVVVGVVGPILDTCSLFTMVSVITVKSAMAVYLAGLPMNVVHGISTAITLVLIGDPMFEKLDRMRTKYGVLPFSD